MGDLVEILPVDDLLWIVALVFGSESTRDLVNNLERIVSIVSVASVTGERGAVEALARISPDVAIVDVGTPWALTVLGSESRWRLVGVPPVHLVAYGITGSAAERRRAAALHAHGYLPPDAGTLEVRGVLEDVCCSLGGRAERCSTRLRGLLTRRESKVADLVSLGLSNQEIAKDLSIAEATVKNHVHSLLGKLGARNRVEAGLLWESERLRF